MMIVSLEVAARAGAVIVTVNTRGFVGAAAYDVRVIRPTEVFVSEWRFAVIVNVGIPQDVFARAPEIAWSQSLSVAEVFATACVAHVVAWERLESRAKRADRAKFFAVLAKVPDVESDD